MQVSHLAHYLCFRQLVVTIGEIYAKETNCLTAAAFINFIYLKVLK